MKDECPSDKAGSEVDLALAGLWNTHSWLIPQEVRHNPYSPLFFSSNTRRQQRGEAFPSLEIIGDYHDNTCCFNTLEVYQSVETYS